MKRFRFLLIFGLLALIIFVMMNANVEKIESVYITQATTENEYILINGKINDLFRLFKGYKYETEGDKMYITVYTTFGLIGDKNFIVKLAENSDINKIYLTDGKDSRVIYNR